MSDPGDTKSAGLRVQTTPRAQEPAIRATATQARLVAEMSETFPDPDRGVVTLDTLRYTSAERYRDESTRIFSAFPRLIAPSALLPERGTSVAIDGYEKPLLITRDSRDKAHVFVNACSHRGTRLVSTSTAQRGKLIVCPYHAWCYNMEGKLQSVTEAESFPGLQRSNYPLKELPSYEAGGLIWFSSDSLDNSHLVDLEEDLDAFGFARSSVFRHRRHSLAANWKLVMDAFLEGYHAPVLHRASIARFFPSKAESFDRSLKYHIRRANARMALETDPTEATLSELKRAATFTYILFPNVILIVSPGYANLLILTPQSVRETLIDDYMLVNHLPEDADQERLLEKSWDLVDTQTFANEDFKVAEWAQEGLESGAVDQITIGQREYLIGQFHEMLDEILRRDVTP